MGLAYHFRFWITDDDEQTNVEVKVPCRQGYDKSPAIVHVARSMAMLEVTHILSLINSLKVTILSNTQRVENYTITQNIFSNNIKINITSVSNCKLLGRV